MFNRHRRTEPPGGALGHGKQRLWRSLLRPAATEVALFQITAVSILPRDHTDQWQKAVWSNLFIWLCNFQKAQKTAFPPPSAPPRRFSCRKRPFEPSRPHALARRGRTHRAPAARPKHYASRQVKPLRSDHAAAAHLLEITSRTSPPERQRSTTHEGAPRLRCPGRRKVP